MKKCIKCEINKQIFDFHKDKKNLDGYSNRCKKCVTKHNNKRYQEKKSAILSINKKYRDNNKKRISETGKKYYKLNSDSIKKRTAEYAKQNRESINKKRNETRAKNNIKANKKAKLYRNKNKKEINGKRNIQIQKRQLVDPVFKLSRRIRVMLNECFKLKGLPKTKKLEDILGLSINDFKEHIESMFQPWMNWNNYGKYNGQLSYGWDIDHIIALCKANTEQELIQLNHYKNLQPLCSKINRDIKKGN